MQAVIDACRSAPRAPCLNSLYYSAVRHHTLELRHHCRADPHLLPDDLLLLVGGVVGVAQAGSAILGLCKLKLQELVAIAPLVANVVAAGRMGEETAEEQEAGSGAARQAGLYA